MLLVRIRTFRKQSTHGSLLLYLPSEYPAFPTICCLVFIRDFTARQWPSSTDRNRVHTTILSSTNPVPVRLQQSSLSMLFSCKGQRVSASILTGTRLNCLYLVYRPLFLQESWASTSISVCRERGVIRHFKSTVWMAIDSAITVLGIILLPCSSSALDIVTVANIVAMAIQRLSSAKNRPGQILRPNPNAGEK